MFVCVGGQRLLTFRNKLRDVSTVSDFFCCSAVAVLSGCLPCCYATPLAFLLWTTCKDVPHIVSK